MLCKGTIIITKIQYNTILPKNYLIKLAQI